jgi:deoxyadenosine/deoxycytidine kinase
MIRFFYLKNERESEIIPLLTHSNEQIRYEALKTAVDLNIDQVNKLLLAYISEINEKYKELIIEFLIKNKIVSSGELMDFFHQENDKRHKLYILQTIYNKDPRGDELIKKLKDFTNNEEIDSMCLHVLNNAY